MGVTKQMLQAEEEKRGARGGEDTGYASMARYTSIAWRTGMMTHFRRVLR